MKLAVTDSVNLLPYNFRGLPYYRRDEIALGNWYASAFQSTADWRIWAGDAFAELLQSPSKKEISLVVKHSLEHDKPEARHKLNGGTVSIGRSPENEIMLAAQSVTKQHARLVFENGACYLEDLGSTLGTYVSNQKLTPHKRISLAPGTQFTIFPYLLTLDERLEWVRGTQVEISQPQTVSMNWSEFLAQSSDAFVGFPLAVHPPALAASLEVGRSFLEHLLSCMLSASGQSPALAGLLPTDSELLGFLLLSVLERANRNLKFPFQFLLGRPLDKPALPADARGIACNFSVAWNGFTGAFRLFLPHRLLEEMQRTWPRESGTAAPVASVSWSLPVSSGYADLTAGETAGLEAGDIVLLTAETSLALPGGDCGWLLAQDTQTAKFIIVRPFQRRLLVDNNKSEAKEEKNPDLGSLPVRLHVILCEKDMTFAEVSALEPGAVLDLDRDKSGHVDIALNGKLAGKGALVEIEGKLGVKILSWSSGRD